MLGHRSGEVILDVYADLFDSDLDDAASSLVAVCAPKNAAGREHEKPRTSELSQKDVWKGDNSSDLPLRRKQASVPDGDRCRAFLAGVIRSRYRPHVLRLLRTERPHLGFQAPT